MSETAINKVNKTYCASAYLAFRFIKDENMNFFQGLTHKVFVPKAHLVLPLNVSRQTPLMRHIVPSSIAICMAWSIIF